VRFQSATATNTKAGIKRIFLIKSSIFAGKDNAGEGARARLTGSGWNDLKDNFDYIFHLDRAACNADWAMPKSVCLRLTEPL